MNITISNTNSEDLLAAAEQVNEYIEDYNRRSSNVQLDVIFDSSIRLQQRTQLLVENGVMGIVLVLFLVYRWHF